MAYESTGWLVGEVGLGWDEYFRGEEEGDGKMTDCYAVGERRVYYYAVFFICAGFITLLLFCAE